jgi:hypothetical protein
VGSCGAGSARRERLWQETRIRALGRMDTPMGRVAGAAGLIWVRRGRDMSFRRCVGVVRVIAV